ncbi:helix-turn-helix domain-containing protein [Caulobacter segnis]|uniref:helix-turn-helix domain-containing protein n=1 Tax=Caulobacter segnis TaxID=88688 RepID=UPI00240ECAF6|nr:helix-turn-helix domain-containing protein [Caulobacter segnis]MDG2520899.1 helix-turn-helix domain-containing protein [Caulobacter segnis]
MPLDMGGVTQLKFPDEGSEVDQPSAPSLTTGEHVGAALKAVREHLGLSLEEVAETTRVRRTYLAAIEDMRLDTLPSRPFAVGYVRAYAKALNLDGEAAVNRFKIDSPDPEQVLRGPVGVEKKTDPRFAMAAVAGVVILAAILAWNVARRVMEPAPQQAEAGIQSAPVAPPVPTTNSGAVSLGAPLPAPVESTTPKPYVTPGLEDSVASGGSADAAIAVAKARAAAKAAEAATPDESIVLGSPFKANGAVMGANPEESLVTLQARKNGALVVRSGDGQVYFARQLNAGEAYRVPAAKGLVADVSDPAAFEVFVAGASKGVLPAAQTSIGKLVD